MRGRGQQLLVVLFATPTPRVCENMAENTTSEKGAKRDHYTCPNERAIEETTRCHNKLFLAICFSPWLASRREKKERKIGSVKTGENLSL